MPLTMYISFAIGYNKNIINTGYESEMIKL